MIKVLSAVRAAKSLLLVGLLSISSTAATSCGDGSYLPDGSLALSNDTEAYQTIGEGLTAASTLDPLATGLGLTFSRRTDLGMVWYNEGVDGFDPPLGTRDKLTVGSNTQVAFPRGMLFGDFDGDRRADALQWKRGRVFITRLDFDRTEIAHLFLPQSIDRVLVGDFIGAGWDQLCALADAMYCYGIDPTRDDQLRFWFKQPLPVGVLEEVIVGDFDGDDKDELFVYGTTNGAMRLLEQSGSGFGTQSSWSRGNLSRVASSGIKFIAGDYTGDGRTDLIARRSNGQLEVFASARSTNTGNDTFWWHFTTGNGFIATDEEILLARVDDDTKADLVVHRPSTGAMRTYHVTVQNGQVPEIDTPLESTRVSANTALAMVASHSFRNEPGANTRDDVLIHDADSDILYNYEARYSTSQQAYVYSLEYSTYAQNNDSGWQTPRQRKGLFMRCQFKDYDDTPSDGIWLDLVSRIQDYYHEVSYGRVDMSSSEVIEPWVKMTMTRSEINAKAKADGKQARETAHRECLNVAGKSRSDYDMTVVFLNRDNDWGARDTMATITSLAFDVWATVHEIGHTYWMGESRSDDPNRPKYSDPWDPMSARGPGFTHQTPFGVTEGTGFNLPNRRTLGALPSTRIKQLDKNSASELLRLSAANRPGGRTVQIEVLLDDATEKYSIEYREPTGFDRNIPRATVLFHRAVLSPGTTSLFNWVQIQSKQDGQVSEWSSHERQPGETFSIPGVGSFEVVSFDTARHLAKLQFTPD